MDQLGTIDTAAALQQNIQNIMKQQQKDEKTLGMLEAGNKAINDDLGVSNPDDYLKQILAGGTAGADTAY